VFSGDLGPKGALILKDFEPFKEADMVFLESTYGDHDHRPFMETVEEFMRIVQETVEKKGKILVPTFAVGRAQLLTGLLAWMFRQKKVKPFPIFLDSPMAIEATKIYTRHRDLFDEGMTKFVAEKPLRADLKTMTMSVTAEDSRKINDVPGPVFDHGWSRNVQRGAYFASPETESLEAGHACNDRGYQSHGSLGRQLVEGRKEVSIHGEKIAVKATIHTLGGFSAHAGQKDLLGWFGVLAPKKPRVVLTHGEDGPRGETGRGDPAAFQDQM
jgi:metallo-beta-lactamase family protein